MISGTPIGSSQTEILRDIIGKQASIRQPRAPDESPRQA